MNEIVKTRPITWLQPVRKLEALAVDRIGLQIAGKIAKYLGPVLSTGSFAAVYLISPGAATIEGLLFYSLLGAASGLSATRGVAKSFRIAEAERTADQEQADRNTVQADLEQTETQLKQSRLQLTDSNSRIDSLQRDLQEKAGEIVRLQQSVPTDSISFDGRHIVIRRLGEGGMAMAFQIFDSKMKVMHVYKIAHPNILEDADTMDRFIHGEAASMLGLNDPNIVRFFKLDYLDRAAYEKITGISLEGKNVPAQIPYIDMEFIPHPTLEKKMIEWRQMGYCGLPEKLAVSLAVQIAKTMSRVNARGVIHRDLKPENVFVVPDETQEGQLTVKVGDFGLAKVIGSDYKLTKDASAFGTPYYMSPEQWSAKPVDHRADQYSLGVMLYEMLSGAYPYGYAAENDSPMAYGMKVTGMAQRVEDLRQKVAIPDQLWAAVQRMLAKNRDHRFATWDKCIAALENSQLIGDISSTGARDISLEPTSVGEYRVSMSDGKVKPNK